MIITLSTIVFMELVFAFLLFFMFLRDVLDAYRELKALPDLQLNSVFLTTSAQSLELKYLILTTKQEMWSKIVGPLLLGMLSYYSNFSPATPVLAGAAIGYGLKGIVTLYVWRYKSKQYAKAVQQW